MRVFEESRWRILNTGSAFTFRSGKKKSTIDIAVLSEKVGKFISGWKVGKNDSLSDHRYLRYSLPAIPIEERVMIIKKFTDWRKYSAMVCEGIVHINWVCSNEGELDSKALALNDIVMSSYKVNCRERTVKPGYGILMRRLVEGFVGCGFLVGFVLLDLFSRLFLFWFLCFFLFYLKIFVPLGRGRGCRG